MPRRLFLLLAALTVLLLATASSALAAAGVQNGVRAFTPAAPSLAGPQVAQSSCSHPSSDAGSAELASGFCVAAEDAAAAANPLTDTTYSQKVLDQMAQGDYHAFPDSVDGFANQSHVTTELGADGSPYTHVRIPGGYGSNEGVFHYIFGDNGVVNHRLFEPGG